MRLRSSRGGGYRSLIFCEIVSACVCFLFRYLPCAPARLLVLQKRVLLVESHKVQGYRVHYFFTVISCELDRRRRAWPAIRAGEKGKIVQALVMSYFKI